MSCKIVIEKPVGEICYLVLRGKISPNRQNISKVSRLLRNDKPNIRASSDIQLNLHIVISDNFIMKECVFLNPGTWNHI